jgi:beta-lactamase superfamily II metal-dependent hydrolase
MPPTLQFEKLAKQGFGFAVFPEARIFESPGVKSIQHLIFGDYITPPKKEGRYVKWSGKLIQEVAGQQWINVRSRQEEGWMKLSDIQLDRILEVNFVDIGQGDGCHVVTPSDDHFIIDAGEGDNMYRFLRWRFNLNTAGKKLPKFYGMMSHPDEDHWGGFIPLLAKIPVAQKRQISFEKLYHNGILQRIGSSLGETSKVDGEVYLTEFMSTQASIAKVLESPGKKSEYEKFLIASLKNFPALILETISTEPNKTNILYNSGTLKLQVLAPVTEMINGKKSLRWFDPNTDAIGKTKNGHSIVITAEIGKMKILLGGDLNSKSADFLMEQYGKSNIKALRKKIAEADKNSLPALKEEMQKIVEKCRPFFQSEVAKSCHHGSHDITNEFLQVINSIVTVISSGDEESFCHPRPETLGAIGKYSRGDRPLIFSTELARSSPEYIELKANATKTDKTKQRIVSTYGLITVRTDGEKCIISQKLEKARSQFGLIVKWHIDKLIWNDERAEFITN